MSVLGERAGGLRERVVRACAVAAVPVLLGAALLSRSCSREADTPPDVVLIVLDTMRADYFSFMGYPRETAPFLAGLAADAAVFEKAYSTSSWTAPSTSSILTGTYPDRHGVLRGFLAQVRLSPDDTITADSIRLNRIRETTETLPEFFSKRGYSTFGLATNINIGPEIGFDRGFDPEHFERHDEWPAGKVHKRLMSWKEDMKAGGPFFLYLHLNDVHKPYEMRRKWFEEVEGVPEKSLYQSEMGYLDHWLSRMLEDLELDDDTLLVVVSDHGEEFLDHGGMGHHLSLFDEVNRILLMFHAPGLGVKPGVYSRPVSGIDVAPTIAELAGFAPPVADQDGISLAPFLLPGASRAVLDDREKRLADRALYAHRVGAEDELHAVIKDGWKMIQGGDVRILFNLDEDEDETIDLRETEPGRLDALTRELDRYRARDFGSETTETGVELDPELLRKLVELGYVDEE